MNRTRARRTPGAILVFAFGGLWCAALFGSSTSCGGGKNDCSDGSDNDGDRLIDSNDPGCLVNGDTEAPDPLFPACSDSVDNDLDGLADSDDPGCTSRGDGDEFNEPIASCRDGLDNDGDGFIDFPNDPGCTVSLEDDESDDCPGGIRCPPCANGRDDDGDEMADYPLDLGCDYASDRDEFNADPSICGDLQVSLLPEDGNADGDVASETTNELISMGCGGSGAETVFQLVVTRPIVLVATTNFAETTFDTVLYLRSACREPDTELGCNDDTGEALGSTLMVEQVEPGPYFLVVDSRDDVTTGDFRLEVRQYLPRGEVCDPADVMFTCLPGQTCRLLTMDAVATTCQPPQCSDDVDFDLDGAIDYPEEPGCENADDADESDTCPAGPDCPACGDGQDNNDPEDNLADYPDDLGCVSASDLTETDCEADTDPLVAITQPATNGSTVGANDDFIPFCTFDSGDSDRTYQLLVPGDLVSLSIDTQGSNLDTVVSIKPNECDGETLACNNDGFPFPDFGSNIQLAATPAGVYYITVDGFFSSASFTLNVSGVIAAGQPCIPAQVNSGLMACENDGACMGGICQ